MHGIIFLELKKYAERKLGRQAWPQLLAASKLQDRMYLPVQEYPDSELMALVEAGASATSKSVSETLEDFGEFIAPDLLQVYRSLVHANWKTLDLIENTEKMIHRVVRMRNPGARPPELIVVRTSATELAITYRSSRQLCAIAKGIARGMAKHYGETLTVWEPQCVHQGAAECQIHVRVER